LSLVQTDEADGSSQLERTCFLPPGDRQGVLEVASGGDPRRLFGVCLA
jgi:hypothetical protein